MTKFLGYRCSLCGKEYSPGEITYVCPKDGGNLDVIIDYKTIRNKYQPEDILSRTDSSLWSFLPLLPVPEPPGEFDSAPRRGRNAGLCIASSGEKTRTAESLAER